MKNYKPENIFLDYQPYVFKIQERLESYGFKNRTKMTYKMIVLLWSEFSKEYKINGKPITFITLINNHRIKEFVGWLQEYELKYKQEYELKYKGGILNCERE